MEEPFQLLCGYILYSETAYFGGKTDKELEQLMKQMGFKYVWIKSQDGHPIFNSAPHSPPQERELESIAPVLQFLCRFAGIEGRGAKEESIGRAETRLGNEGQAVGLYDSEERTFWFVTRDEPAQERLENMFGFSPED